MAFKNKLDFASLICNDEFAAIKTMRPEFISTEKRSKDYTAKFRDFSLI